MKFSFSISLIIIVGIIFSLPSVMSAQIFTPYTIEDAQTEFEIITTPKNPSLGDVLDVEVSSFAIDLNNSEIQFYKNSELLQSEIGVTAYRYGQITERTDIRIVIETPEGLITERTRVIIPGSVNIIWEAETYTPPFYKGKALYTKEAPIILTAIPTMRDAVGNIITSNNLDYTWRINGQTRNNLGGIGKSTISLDEIFLGSGFTASVTVESKNGQSIASDSVDIFHNTPRITFYKNDPLYGINFSETISTLETEDEVSVFASPLYFGTTDLNDLNFTWSTNGRTISENSNVLTLRNESGQTGLVNLQLAAENISSFFERAVSSIRIQFN